MRLVAAAAGGRRPLEGRRPQGRPCAPAGPPLRNMRLFARAGRAELAGERREPRGARGARHGTLRGDPRPRPRPRACPGGTVRHPRLVLAIFILSGAAGLMDEVVWSRQLVLVFGNTTQAVSTILTGFFGGLAVGSFVGGRAGGPCPQPAPSVRPDRARPRRRRPAHPGHVPAPPRGLPRRLPVDRGPAGRPRPHPIRPRGPRPRAGHRSHGSDPSDPDPAAHPRPPSLRGVRAALRGEHARRDRGDAGRRPDPDRGVRADRDARDRCRLLRDGGGGGAAAEP